MAPDGKYIIWKNTDTGGRGAVLEFHCNSYDFELHTRESLLEMADPDDGEIKVVFMSPTHDRLAEDGKLLGDLHGVKFEEKQFNNWMRFKEHGQLVMTMTVLLSNNGKQEAYSFDNRFTPEDEHDLDCDMPKLPKKPKR